MGASVTKPHQIPTYYAAVDGTSDGGLFDAIHTTAKKGYSGLSYKNLEDNISKAVGIQPYVKTQDMVTNLAALVDAIVKQKPAAAKGTFIKKIAVSTTMGVGLTVDKASLDNTSKAE